MIREIHKRRYMKVFTEKCKNASGPFLRGLLFDVYHYAQLKGTKSYLSEAVTAAT